MGVIGAFELWRLCGREDSVYDCNNSHISYSSICLAGRPMAVPHQKFPSPAAEAKHSHPPNSRSTTREEGNDFHGWAVCTDGRTRSSNGETIVAWGVVAPSLEWRIFIMFGPGYHNRSTAHLPSARRRIHSSITAELSSVVEAISFPVPMAQVPVIHALASSLITSTQSVSAWSQPDHGRMFILDSHVIAFDCKIQSRSSQSHANTRK